MAANKDPANSKTGIKLHMSLRARPFYFLFQILQLLGTDDPRSATVIHSTPSPRPRVVRAVELQKPKLGHKALFARTGHI